MHECKLSEFLLCLTPHDPHGGTRSSIQYRSVLFQVSVPGNQQLFSPWLPGPCVSGAGTWSGTELVLVMHWISPAVLYLCLSSSCRINFPPSSPPPRYALHALPLVVFGGKWVIWQKEMEKEGEGYTILLSESKISNNLSRRVLNGFWKETLWWDIVLCKAQPVKRFS